jgi:hypothetical protein
MPDSTIRQTSEHAHFEVEGTWNGDVYLPAGVTNVAHLWQEIADKSNYCPDLFTLTVNNKLLQRTGWSTTNTYRKQTSLIKVLMTLKPKPDLTNTKECAKFCATCLKQAGADAKQILHVWIEEKMPIDARALRAADLPLKDILDARRDIPSLHHAHPPASNKTLFDGQLADAGFEAIEFKRAGYTAGMLSRIYFMTHPPDAFVTPGDQEWEETKAFFSAPVLQDAGFSELELRDAFDRSSLLQMAGISRSQRRELFQEAQYWEARTSWSRSSSSWSGSSSRSRSRDRRRSRRRRPRRRRSRRRIYRSRSSSRSHRHRSEQFETAYVRGYIAGRTEALAGGSASLYLYPRW